MEITDIFLLIILNFTAFFFSIFVTFRRVVEYRNGISVAKLNVLLRAVAASAVQSHLNRCS